MEVLNVSISAKDKDHPRIKTKQCTKCAKVLPITEFGWQQRDGYRSHCKECRRKESKEWCDKNKEYLRARREENKEKMSKYLKQYRIKNGDVLRAKGRAYYEMNQEELNERRRACGKTVKSIYRRLKDGSIKRGIPLKIPFETFKEWYNKQEKVCVYCGIDEESLNILSVLWTGKNKNRRMSIDRIDNAVPYELDNIILACFTCNMIKGRHLSFEQMKFIGTNFLKSKWQNLLESQLTHIIKVEAPGAST